MPDVLGRRALNRATMARQLLLERADLPPLSAVEHLVGMQAQVPLNPYLGLWSRLAEFRTEDLAQLLVDRAVVRIAVMRGTIHLVTADDCLLLRPLCQPVLDAELARHPEHGAALRGLDPSPVLKFVRRQVEERPLSGTQLRAVIAAQFPDLDASAWAYAARNLLAFVQVPPRGVWGRSARVSSTTAESWLRRPLVAAPSIDHVVLRYLAAFGPATAADMAAWSRLTGFREVVERLRPRLRTFHDERGRELVDVPDAPLPDPDTPAPTRFLPEYDNVVLSHSDRSRFTPDPPLSVPAGTPVHGSVLHDGFLCATWSIARSRDGGSATMTVRHVALAERAVASITAEGGRALAFLEPAASAREVRSHQIEE